MKRSLTLLSILLLTLLLTSFSFGQAPDSSKEGKVAILFTLNGLSNIGTTPYNGGVGLKYYMTNSIALRGSLGGTYKKYADADGLNTTASFGVTTDILGTKNTNAYIGGEVIYNHSQPEVTNSYGLAGIIGGEFFPWENVSLGTEYKIIIDRNPQADVTTVSLGKDNANFTLAIYFN